MAIGGRSQSARTYLERHLEEFAEASLADLINHGLRALRDTLPNELELTAKVSGTDGGRRLNRERSGLGSKKNVRENEARFRGSASSNAQRL